MYDYASQMELAKQYWDDESDDGVAKDYVKASELAQEMIAQGYAEGYYIEAKIANNENNYEKAFENYNKALDGTDEDILGQAMNMIGYYYMQGFGVEQDYAKAIEWHEKGYELGGSKAGDFAYSIATFYYSGKGVEQDSAKAEEAKEE